MKRLGIGISGMAVLALWVQTAWGGEQFILRAPKAVMERIVSRHGFTVTKKAGADGAWVVASPTDSLPAAVLSEIKRDSGVESIEQDKDVSVPEVDGGVKLGQSTAAILDMLAGNALVPYYGSNVWSAYSRQMAAVRTLLPDVQKMAVTGSGLVAVIDTGVDPTQPALQGSLVPGYDFVNDIPGSASEWIDLDDATAAILKHSGDAGQTQMSILGVNQSTAAILDQSTAAILDTTKLPAAFGHGTMIAGIIHLVAPTARIMPLKAFKGDGTARMSDIVSAIRFAVDNGAQVINMSFSTPVFSIELMKAVNYANKNGVLCVASAGNNGLETMVYPAGLHNVIGVASADSTDARSSFSNFGPALVHLAAPGERIMTLYPGGRYAVVSGTSFAAPFVSGAAALLFQVDEFPGQAETFHAFCSNTELTLDLGCGRLDLLQAVRFLQVQ